MRRTAAGTKCNVESSEMSRLVLLAYASLHYRSRALSCFFFSSRRRHTRFDCDWSSDVCSSDLAKIVGGQNGSLDPLPRGMDHVVKGCLTKDREERWQNVADIKRQLEWLAEGGRSEERRVGEEGRSRGAPYH